MVQDVAGKVFLDILYNQYKEQNSNQEKIETIRGFTAKLRVLHPNVKTTSTTSAGQRLTVCHGVRLRLNGEATEEHRHHLHHLQGQTYLFVSKHSKNYNRVSFEIKYVEGNLTVSIFGQQVDILRLGLGTSSPPEIVERTLSHVKLCRGIDGVEDTWTEEGTDITLQRTSARACKRILYANRTDSLLCGACYRLKTAIIKEAKETEEEKLELDVLANQLKEILPDEKSELIIDILKNSKCATKSQRRWQPR